MYPLKQKPLRDRLHRQACERAGIPADMRLSPSMGVTLHEYKMAVEDIAIARIFELEDVLGQILLDAEYALEPGNDAEGLGDALKQIVDRIQEVANTTTRQPDDG